MIEQRIQDAYALAKESFAEQGVEADRVLDTLDAIPISIHCWQGDDVLGFENSNGTLTGGIQTTGNYPGRARNPQELRADLELALSLIPGRKRVNLHAIYLDAEGHVERDAIQPAQFQSWIDWARREGLGLDFNPTCFSHPKSAQNLTLSHPDAAIRKFWIDHCIASRRISEHMGKELNSPAIISFAGTICGSGSPAATICFFSCSHGASAVARYSFLPARFISSCGSLVSVRARNG